MTGDNPGTYQPYIQTEAWPFLPAVGLALGLAAAVMFAMALFLALKRAAPFSWAIASGLVAAVASGASIHGLLAAAEQWEERDRAKYSAYISEVAGWISDEIGQPISTDDAARLLRRETVTVSTDQGMLAIGVTSDRSTRLLVLDIRR